MEYGKEQDKKDSEQKTSLPSSIFAVISTTPGEGIVTFDGCPLVCLTRELSIAFSVLANEVAILTQRRLVVIKFTNAQVIEEFNGAN